MVGLFAGSFLLMVAVVLSFVLVILWMVISFYIVAMNTKLRKLVELADDPDSRVVQQGRN